MYFERGEADPAIQLLNAAIDKNPAAAMQNQLRVKLGNALPAEEGRQRPR